MNLYIKAARLGLIIAVVIFAAGCGAKTAPNGPEATQVSSNQKVMVVVLIDETASFVRHWQDSLKGIQQVVKSLKAGDGFAVVGIADTSWREEDTLIQADSVPASGMKAIMFKSQLLRQVQALQPRSNTSGSLVKGKARGLPEGTDLLGALDYSCKVASDNAAGRRINLIAFSDFEDEQRSNSGRLTSRPLDPSIAFSAFDVNAGQTGHEFVSRIGHWISRIANLGIEANPPDFHISTQSTFDIVIRR